MSTIPASNLWFSEIHFLDVGHGDCTIVDIPDRLTVIDINNCKTLAKESEEELRNKYKSKPRSPLLNAMYSGATQGLGGISRPPTITETLADMVMAEQKLKAAKDRLTNPIDYLQARFPGRSIFRYIQTHPDMDHMAGLHRLLEERVQIINFWDTNHSVTKDEDALRSGQVNKDIRDWHAYQWLRAGGGGSTTVLTLTMGAAGEFWSHDGIKIWAPRNHRHSLNQSVDPNALSYVLFMQVGNCNILFGGDATIEMWEEIYAGFPQGRFPKVHLLKASHHGRKSGYHMPSVRAMNPDVTILSVGELKAKDDANASYEKFSNKGCHSTLDHGDIIARCWSDGDVWLRERDSSTWFLKTFAC